MLVFLEIGTQWSAQSRTCGMQSGWVSRGKSSELHELKRQTDGRFEYTFICGIIASATASQTKFKLSLFILRTIDSILFEPDVKQFILFDAASQIC